LRYTFNGLFWFYKKTCNN